ncbi:MAG: prephenate dehydratase [Actinomycetia bacterium]|nr:prephenate dehydratase [Actinomycetes bacterium]MCH9801215.1 prephenate dehydratase [Actinomycetes bacterium]
MSTTEVVYLGPPGTFSEMAVAAMPKLAEATTTPATSVMAALDQVRSGEADLAVVPIENSVEGSVSGTLDELAAQPPLRIAAEITIPVRFALMVAPGQSKGPVRMIGTHPHAAAQCRRWIHDNYPEAGVAHTDSTAAGAMALATPGEPGFDAAIATTAAAEQYGLEVIASDIADNREAVTRFVGVGRPGPLPAATGADKTSLVLYIHANRAGALLEILTELAVRGINMTRVESRPTRHALGDYCFSIDIEGHAADTRVGEALLGLRRVCADVLFLGSYPRWDGVPTNVPSGLSNADYQEASDWLTRIRNGES